MCKILEFKTRSGEKCAIRSDAVVAIQTAKQTFGAVVNAVIVHTPIGSFEVEGRYDDVLSTVRYAVHTGAANPALQDEASSKDPNSLLSDKEVADILGVSYRTLQSWRQKGEGPSFQKVGTLIKYRRAVIDHYIKQRTGTLTSDLHHGASGSPISLKATTAD